MPPTGKAIEVAGTDFITYCDDGVHSVRGYFSPGDGMRQIRMDVIIQPKAVGVSMFSSVWKPGYINTLMVRCTNCATMNRAQTAGGRCKCGAGPPAHRSYW